MPFVDYMWFTNEQLYLLDQDGLGAKIEFPESFYWVQLTVWLVLSVGMYFFVSVARTLFLIAVVISLIGTLFFGVRSITPYESFLITIISQLDGAIIILAYFTGVGVKFDKNS